MSWCDGLTGTACREGGGSGVSDEPIAGDCGDSVNGREGDVAGDCGGVGVDGGEDCDGDDDGDVDEGDRDSDCEEQGNGLPGCPVWGPRRCLLWQPLLCPSPWSERYHLREVSLLKRRYHVG